MKITFTFLFISIFMFGFGQKNYSDGYVITLQNDTLHGKIRDRFLIRFQLAPNIIKYMDNNKIITKYKPKEIKGYSKAGLVNYMTIQDDFNKNFARILINGEIKLLTIRKSGSYSNSSSNGIGGTDTSYDSYSKDLYFLYNSLTSQTTKVYQIDFKNQMTNYFSDYEELKILINNKELRYSDLEIIVEKYNQWKKEKTL